MTKIITSADWHLKNSDSYGVYDSAGVNDFLLFRSETAKRIIQSAIDLDGHLVIAGDMLDDKVVDSVTMYYASQLVKMMQNTKLTIMLEGNHGYDGKNNIHSSIAHWKHLVTNNIKIITGYTVIHKDGISYHCIPAVNDIEKNFMNIVEALWRNRKEGNVNILVIHGPIIGARFDSGTKSKTGIKMKEVESVSRKYDYIVCGDFHRYQNIFNNTWNTGSLMQTSLRDKNQDKGYQIIDTENDEVDFVTLGGLRFIELSWEVGIKISPVLRKPCMYKGTLRGSICVIRLLGTSSEINGIAEDLDTICNNLTEHGCIRVFIDKQTTEAKRKRSTISMNMGIQEMIESYVDYKKNLLPAKKKQVVEKGLLYIR